MFKTPSMCTRMQGHKLTAQRSQIPKGRFTGRFKEKYQNLFQVNRRQRCVEKNRTTIPTSENDCGNSEKRLRNKLLMEVFFFLIGQL